MTKHCVALLLALLLALPVLGNGSKGSDTPADGCQFFRQACEKQAAVAKKHEAAVKEIDVYLKTGSKPSPLVLAYLVESREAMELLRQADTAAAWTMPASSCEYVPASRFHPLAQATAANAIGLLRDGKVVDAWKQLAMVRRICFRAGNNSGAIGSLVGTTDRRKLCPAIASAIDALPEDQLKNALAELRREDESRPQVSTALRRDFAEGKLFFSDGMKKELFDTPQVAALKKGFEENLKKQAFSPEETKKILDGSPLSGKWLTDAFDEYEAICTPFWNKVDTASMEDVKNISAEVEAKLDIIRAKAKGAEDAEKMLAELATAKGTPEMMLSINTHISEVLKAKIVSLNGCASAGICFLLRLQHSREHLLLVRLAARVYEAQTGAWPKAWQELVDAKLLEPEMILDVVSGKPLLMRTDADGRPDAYFIGKESLAKPLTEIRLAPLSP